jgi:hypothetical protein
MLGYHSWIVCTVRERKHCPRTQVLTKTGSTDCPSNSSSLPLYVLLHQTSNIPSSVPPWLPPEASSSHPTPFHFSRSILSYAAFTSRAPSMPTAMPTLAHTTQLRKQVGHAFPCNNDGAPSQQDG